MKEMDFPTYTVNKNIDEIRKMLKNPSSLKDLVPLPPGKKVFFHENEIEIEDDTLGVVKMKIEEVSDNSFKLIPEIPSMPDRTINLHVDLSMIDSEKTEVSFTLEHDLPIFVAPIVKMTLKDAFSKFFAEINNK